MKTGTILVVEPDDEVRKAIERDLLARYGDRHQVLSANDAEGGLATCAELRRRDGPVAVLIAGERLDAMSGADFLLQAKLLHPQAGRVVLTAHHDVDAAIADVNEAGIDRYLLRSSAPDQQLYPIMDELLADWEARRQLPYLTVRAIMDAQVARIGSGDSLAVAARAVAATGIGDLMVIDDDGLFVGVLSEGDILRNCLPDLEEILQAGGTLHDGYELFMRKSHELSDRSIGPLVIRDPIVMHPDDHVAKAAVILIDRQIRRLPVVESGKLLGTVSRANICQAVVGTW
jgi:CBS domain-containing protein